MLLPEELVHFVVTYLAYRLAYRSESQGCDPPELQAERVSSDILSLSSVNRRLRRICLPFLILHIKSYQHVKELQKHFSLKLPLLDSAKMLILNAFYKHFKLEEGDRILCEALTHMKCLSYVDITGEVTIALLIALHKHPNVSTILVRSTRDLPDDRSIVSDLSKVVLERATVYNPMDAHLLWWRTRGIKVSQLLIRQPELLTDEFGSQIFSGLSELDLAMSDCPVTVSWLSEFASSHSYLKKIRFIDEFKRYFDRHTLPFISSFVEGVRDEQLCDAYSLTHLVISRFPLSSTVFSQEWRVTAMVISIESSLIEILSLIYSSFPELQTLQLHFEGNSTYHIDDVIGTLRLFSSLELLSLHWSLKRFHFGRKKPWRRDIQRVDGAPPAANLAEAGILWYSCRIAQRVPSLQAVYIHEKSEQFCKGGRWCLRGWLRVSNAPDGGREVVGKLR